MSSQEESTELRRRRREAPHAMPIAAAGRALSILSFADTDAEDEVQLVGPPSELADRRLAVGCKAAEA
jgi:hypothetical protein